MRKVFPRHFGDAQILDYDAIRLDPIEILKKLIEPIGFTVFKNGINRDEYLLALVVGDFERSLKLIESKIRGAHSSIKRAQPEVNRIGTFAKSGGQSLYRTGRGE